MKTAEQKAIDWLNDNVAGWSGTQLSALTNLIKEQDRDTRLACAEAVIQHGDALVLEMIDRCHTACLSVKVV